MILVVLSLPISYISTGLTPKAESFASKIIFPVPHTAPAPNSSDPVGDEWPMFRGSLNHTGTTESTPVKGSNPLWNYSTSDMFVSSPAVANGCVYIGSFDNYTYCLNATTGAQVWNYSTTGIVHSSPAVANDCVYIGSEDHNIYCLNASTGIFIWNYSTGGIIQSSPAVANGSVYVGSEDQLIYCLNASTGVQLWNYTTCGSIYTSSPAVANGRVYAGGADGNISCIDALTGAFVWNFTTAGGTFSPAVANGLVYAGSSDGKIYCLDESTGEFVWDFATGGEVGSSPAVANGLVYAGSDDRNVYCVDATTGAFVWNYTTGYHVRSSPAVANGLVYVGSDDTILYCLNATTGSVTWKYATGAGIYSSPAIASGCVYIGSEDNNTYCLPMTLTPSPPLNLQVIGGDRHVNLTWQPPANDGGVPIQNYSIYRGLSEENEDFLALIDTQLNYTDFNLINGQTYYYKVSALTIAGEGPLSVEVNAIPCTVPDAPQNLQSIGGNGNVTLSWQVPTDNGGAAITHYNISRSTSSGNEIYLVTVDNVTEYTDVFVLKGQNYFYTVCAINVVGEGPQSGEVNATTFTNPNAPQNFQASAGIDNISLSWQSPTINGGMTITAYKIYRGDVSNGEALLILLDNVTNYTDTEIVRGQIYYYLVSAVNPTGEGPLSSEISAASFNIPSYPVNLTASAGIGKVFLSWGAPISNGGVTDIQYIVYRGIIPGDITYLATVENAQNYTDTNVVNGHTYYYKISAKNLMGESSLTVEVNAIPIIESTPPPFMTQEIYLIISILAVIIVGVVINYVFKRRGTVTTGPDQSVVDVYSAKARQEKKEAEQNITVTEIYSAKARRKKAIEVATQIDTSGTNIPCKISTKEKSVTIAAKSNSSVEGIRGGKLKRSGIVVLLNCQRNEGELFHVPEIIDQLRKQEGIGDVLLAQGGRVSERILRECNVFLPFCSSKKIQLNNAQPTMSSIDVWDAVLAKHLPIIPVYANPEDIPTRFASIHGIQFNSTDIQGTVTAIAQRLMQI